MSNACDRTNFVPPQALWRWNFFKWMVPVLLGALLLGLIGLERQYAQIGAPMIEAGPPESARLSGRGTPGSLVDIQLDGRSVGQATVNAAGGWSLDADTLADAGGADAGDHRLVAFALDPEGNVRGESSAWQYTIGTTLAGSAPSLAVARSGNSFVLAGTGTPGTTVEVFNNGVSLGTVPVDADGRWSLVTTTQPYGNSFVARGFADDGSTLGDSETVEYAPAALTAGALSLAGATYSWRGTGEPGTTVAVLRNGEQIGTTRVDARGNWSFTGSTRNLAGGDYALSAAALDADGNAVADANSGATLSVPMRDLVLGEAALADDGTSFSWSGTGEPGSEIVIMLDGAEIGRTTVAEDGTWRFDGAVGARAAGNYALSAQMLDRSGSVMGEATAAAPLTVGAAGATATDGGFTPGEAVASEDDAGFSWGGTGVPGSEVVILLNGEEIGRTTVAEDGSWQFTSPAGGLNAGQYRLSAQQLDASGTVIATAEAATELTLGGTDSGTDAPTGNVAVIVAGSDADSDTPGTAPVGAPAVALILDSSWSMTFGVDYTGEDVGPNTDETQRLTADDPNSRIAVAKAGLIDFVENGMPEGTPTALRVFGNLQGDLQCQTDLMVPYGQLNRAEMIETIEAVRPMFNANTTIARSLEQTAEDLADSDEGNRTIVLLTDGDDTCGGNTQAVIEELAEQGFEVSVNIIGFAINDEALKSKLEQWAEAGNGQFFDASDAESLTESLKSAFAIPYIVLDPDGTEVGNGRVGGEPVALPAGSYSVQIQTAPVQTFEIEVVVGETTTVTTE